MKSLSPEVSDEAGCDMRVLLPGGFGCRWTTKGIELD
jgi:hypothetical protein